MAATIAKAIGTDNGRIKHVHRLGSMCSEGQANTWRTFTRCLVHRDGSGCVQVSRDGKVIHRFEFDAEPKES